MKRYSKRLYDSLLHLDVRGLRLKSVKLNSAMQKIVYLIKVGADKGNKLIFIGNGGSASIASHISIDFLKNAGIRSLAFNDSSLLTCISNDLGYESVFQKPLEIMANRGDILFAVSSSGSSANIINAVKEARKRKCLIITLSGFSPNNPLRKIGDFNFYVPSANYGLVEIAHLTICHYIADTIISLKKKKWTSIK
ncbi:MAG: phosphoheptose isomerase [Candidatus Omnitrophota bacterium]|nr:MAG: phosphoheptose isomerase [Candidatus Omnitrophota bacterium]